jgi:hypothetical protein
MSDAPVVVSFRGIHKGLTEAVSTHVPKVVRDPVRQAVLLAQFGESMRALELAEQQGDPEVLIAPDNRMSALIQSFAAEGTASKSEYRPLSQGGVELKFYTDDYLGWSSSLINWIDGLSPHRLIRPTSTVPQEVPNKGRIAVLGDWGTGLYGATVCAQSIQHDPDPFFLLLHLGDVYYAGTSSEVKKRFLALWPNRPDAINRALNSNHEMYSGGHAFFGSTLPQFGQASSYFAMQNEHWLLIGLDTAYIEHNIDDEQFAWISKVIAEAGNRRVVFFSHHQLFSLLDKQGILLAAKLGNLLASNKVFAWYWGHEHLCALYDPHPHYGLHARCIGHSGMPYTRKPLGDASTSKTVGDLIWRKLDGKGAIPGCLALDGPNVHIKEKAEKYGPNGYLVLDLNGPHLTESVYSDNGEILHQNALV